MAAQQVPISDVVLLDFAGDGRKFRREISRANAANGRLVVMRNGDSSMRAARLHRQAAGVFSDGRKINLGDVARIYLGSVANTPGFPINAGNSNAMPKAGARGSDSGPDDGAPPTRRETPSSCRRTSMDQHRHHGQPGQRLRFEPSGEVRLSLNGDDIARPSGR